MSFGLKAQNSPSDFLIDYKTEVINGNDLLTQVTNSTDFPAEINFQNQTLKLFPSNVISDNYKGLTQDGVVSSKEDLAVPFKGYTNKGGKVSLTLGENFIYGFIDIQGDRLYIEPLKYYDKSAENSEIIVYKKSDIKESAPKTCAVNETENSDIKKSTVQKMNGQCYDVEYAVCSDWLMVNKYGSVSAVEDRNVGVVNNVATDYDDAFADQLNLVLTGQYTSSCSTCDPWTSSTSSGVLLPNFANWSNSSLSIPHDVASLWTARDFDGSTIGLAYVGVVCNNNLKYNVLEDFNSDAELIRVLTTHELGHNFGATHDAGGSPYIMAPSVQNTSSWSTASVNSIENYYNNVSCLTTCIPSGTPPTINFTESSTVISEYSVTGSAGSCNQNFEQIEVGVSLSNVPASSITAQITAASSSTAIAGRDYEIINSTVTFSPGQSIFQTFTINIFEDHINEVTEELILNLAITNGNGNNGTTMSHTITIEDNNDDFSATCCSGGVTVDYGATSNTNYSANSIFYGDLTDARSRTIILASELTQAGLGAGSIDALALLVTSKGSSGTFNNFRIGLAHTSNSTLNSMSWIGTTEVFNDNVETVSGTNAFYFDTPFVWDGTSNLYIQFCFNNSSVIGSDNVAHIEPLVSTSTQMLQFQVNNGADGCNNINTNSTYSFNIPIQPRILFYSSNGAIAETESGSFANTEIYNGETANMYSDDDEIIVTINNLGSGSINCLEATVETSGTGKLSAGFGNGNYSQKTYQVTGDNTAPYDLTLYFTEQELNTWGSSANNLSIVKSAVPLDQATDTDVEIIEVSEIIDNAGGNPQKSFKALVTGFGYFALTDIVPSYTKGNLENADLVIGTGNRGILLKSPNGTIHRVYATNSNTLTAVATSGQTMACLPEGDLFISTVNKGIIMKKPGSGYLDVSINNSGAFSFAGISSLPQNKVILYNGDFEIQEIGKGIILQSSDGTCWRLSVSDSGTIDILEMGNCP